VCKVAVMTNDMSSERDLDEHQLYLETFEESLSSSVRDFVTIKKI